MNRPLNRELRQASFLLATRGLDGLEEVVLELLSAGPGLPQERRSLLETHCRNLQTAGSLKEAMGELQRLRDTLEAPGTSTGNESMMVQTSTEIDSIAVQQAPATMAKPPVPNSQRLFPVSTEGNVTGADTPPLPMETFTWSPPALPEKVLDDFFAEVQEYLYEVSSLVMSPLTPGSEELQELYRKLHTVKGNSGMVGLNALQVVAHRMEDMVKGLRDAGQPPGEEHRSILAEGAVLGLKILDLARAGLQEDLPIPAFLSSVGAVSQAGGSSRPPSPSSPPSQGGPRSTASRMLRVDFEQVDRLATMVGEQALRREEVMRSLERLQEWADDFSQQVHQGLDNQRSVRQSMVDYLRGASTNIGLLMAGLESTAQHMELVSSGVQSAVLDLRMVGLEGLFRRHEMTVFQASRSQGKKVRLLVEANEARIDKSIAEKLEEPLIHLVRNAVSHGIQTPEQRRAIGKSEEGQVTIRAITQGNQVVIQVEDDGAGIDPDVIRRKAVEKGFLTQEEAALLDADKATDLLFAPGFSTTSQVNDISGRGVGLDVVRDKINRLRGAVQVISHPNQGTVFQLTLPLTLALARVMLAEVAGETLALPADAVSRVITLSPGDLGPGRPVSLAHLPEGPIPLVHLGHALGLSHMMVLRDHYTAVVVQHGGKVAAFLVDSVLEHIQAVIRQAGEVLPELPHSMGVTFHEGRCVLIVDVGKVLREFLERGVPEGGEKPARLAFGAATWEPASRLQRLFRYERLEAVLAGPGTPADPQLHGCELWIEDGEGVGLLERLAAARKKAPHARLVVTEPSRGLRNSSPERLFEAGVEDVIPAAEPPGRFMSRVLSMLRS